MSHGTKKNYTEKDVTIVVCAYKECKYLEECVKALLSQTLSCKIKISTSTPNDFISGVADKYGIEIWVNPNGGHTQDYNYALARVETELCVLAHQDDILASDYVECCLRKLQDVRRPIIVFTDYIEMHNDIVDARQSKMVQIKKMLLWPLKIPGFGRHKLGKRLLQCLGNPITHPSVMYVKREMPSKCFREAYKASMDWDLWERLSKKKGEFVYVNKILLYHRMNSDNTTAVLFNTSNCRYEEEMEIFCRFWPRWIARQIMKIYSRVQKYY